MNYNVLLASIIVLILIVPIIVVYTMTLQWIQKLEETKCKCSESSQRDFIKYYLYAYLILLAITAVLGFASVFMEFSKVKWLKTLKPFAEFIRMIIAVLSFVNMIVSVIYISKLKEIDCKCSEDMRREVYYIWSIISLAVNVLFLLFMIIGATWLYFVFYK
jgi:hypothetical protein